MLRALSKIGFAAMGAGIILLMRLEALLARHAVPIAIQAAAVALMIAARLTFGRRSFHPAADPTAGELVTTGPYAYLRHPIYAAVLYFAWAGAIDRLSGGSAASAGLVTAGAVVRMLCEERLLVERYPAYRAYMSRVRRVVPFVV